MAIPRHQRRPRFIFSSWKKSHLKSSTLDEDAEESVKSYESVLKQ